MVETYTGNTDIKDRVVIRHLDVVDGKEVIVGETPVINELPIGRINYGARPDGKYGPSPVLPEEITRLDLRRISTTRDSQVTIAGTLVGGETVEIPLVGGIGEHRIDEGHEIVVYAESATAAVKSENDAHAAKLQKRNKQRRHGW